MGFVLWTAWERDESLLYALRFSRQEGLSEMPEVVARTRKEWFIPDDSCPAVIDSRGAVTLAISEAKGRAHRLSVRRFE